MAYVEAFNDDYSGFDINAKDHRKHIEPVWARMRDRSTLPRSEKYGGYYIVTRHDHVSTVARNAKVFSSEINGIAMPDLHAGTRLIPVESDPPFHTEYRSLFMPFVTAEAIGRHAPIARRIATDLMDQFCGKDEIDFVSAFARPLPALVVLAILGVADADVERLAHLIDTSIDGAEGEGRGGPQALAAGREFSAYLDELLDQKRAAAFDPSDIISTLVHASLPKAPLGRSEQKSLLKIFILGGFTTTTFALASAIRWLVEHPGDLVRLREKPSLLDTALDEFVRFASPGTYTARTVTTDVTICDTPLREGDRIVICEAAANRDPRVFERPEEIVLDRAPNRHLGFGHGPHACMGLHLARLELRVALEECLKRFGQYELDKTREIRWASGETQGMLSLPLRRQR